jgi:cell division protein FtsA
VITADLPALKNLILCIERCHLTVESLIAAPYAAGLAALAPDETEIGATVLDLGNGTTTAAVFAAGDCVHVDGIALGGSHVTMDLARGLGTTPVEAERLKTLHGSVLAGTSDEMDMVTVPAVHGGEHDTANAVSRSSLVRMIRPRIDEILEVIRDRLKASNMISVASRRIVITGGGAQLTGVADLVGRVFGATTRVGRPLGMTNFSEPSRGRACLRRRFGASCVSAIRRPRTFRTAAASRPRGGELCHARWPLVAREFLDLNETKGTCAQARKGNENDH